MAPAIARMPMRLRRALMPLLCTALSLLAHAAWGQSLPAQGGGSQAPLAVPALTARVTDLAQLLSAADRERLEARLAEIERRKGAQVAVLIVPSTAPEDIAAYAIRVVEVWQLGRARAGGVAVDDGVLLLVALQDRRVRIEVGRGLEGAIPDAIARRLIAETIAPRFREGAYAEGIAQGIEALARLIEGEALPAPWVDGAASDGERAADAEGADPFFPWIVGLMVGLAVAGRAGRLPGGVIGGAAAGGAALLTGLPLWLALASGLGMLVIVPLVLAIGGPGGAGGIGLPRGGSGPVWRGGDRRGGGWGGGVGGGGRGGLGGGGFRGGGGSFGGGGASGDW